MTQPAWTQAFADAARKRFRATQVPGAAFALAHSGEVVAQGGYGYRDKERKLRATPETLFGVGSLTKSFTALAVMQLQEQGLLSVQDPVTRWLPELNLSTAEHTQQVKIHHLLTHTSGIPPLPSLFYVAASSMKNDPSLGDFPLSVDLNSVYPVETYDGLVELLGQLDYDLLGPPGRYFSYSNDGYGLLGAVIERATGNTYRAYIEENLLRPMGLNRTTFDVTALDKFPEVTELYSSSTRSGRRRVFAAPPWWQYFTTEPAVGLISNVHDMLRYLEVFRTGGIVQGCRVVSEQSIEQLLAPRVAMTNMPGMFYGYGIMIQPDYHSMTVVEHGGGSKGVDAHFMYIRQRDTTLVVLANLVGTASRDVAGLMLNAATGLPLDAERLALPRHDAPSHRLSALAGRYATAEGAEVEFVIENSILMARMQGKLISTRFFDDDALIIEVGPGMPVRFLHDQNRAVFAVAMGMRIYPKVGKGR